MVDVLQSNVRNRLLRALSPMDFSLLAHHLTLVDAPIGMSLVTANMPVDVCYFPEIGFASSVAAQMGKELEIGMIGAEGLIGAVPVLLGDDRTPHAIYVQSVGTMHSIATPVLLEGVDRSSSLRRLMLRYIQSYMIQIGLTAYAQGTLGLEGRMARWLLMSHDRVAGDEILLTHEYLSVMLGVQRAGVTITLQNLEGAGRIKSRRKRIQILDRDRLAELTGGIYGIPEAEYERLVGRA